MLHGGSVRVNVVEALVPSAYSRWMQRRPCRLHKIKSRECHTRHYGFITCR
jgi:hypothetical protein